MLSHFFRLIGFQRTGVGLLLGDPYDIQHIQNCSALDFKLSGQIIDSNFHPLCVSSTQFLGDHKALTAMQVFDPS